jgi:hypothetical protein
VDVDVNMKIFTCKCRLLLNSSVDVRNVARGESVTKYEILGTQVAALTCDEQHSNAEFGHRKADSSVHDRVCRTKKTEL